MERASSQSAAAPRPGALDDVGPGLPFLPDGAMPPPESKERKRYIRAMALFALVVSATYLTWRALFTLNVSAWFVAFPLLILEIHHAVGLGIYAFSLWDRDPPPAPAPVRRTDLKIALLIPTYDESIEVLLPVIGAALAIEPAHETWVLDDGNRSEIADLAEGLGARYLARTENIHAKAGNINNALKHIDADVIAVVDADHVVLPGFLTNTLGYFEDPKVAVVQTPQDFYNVDSFEHAERDSDERRFNEQAVFYRVILPAKNRWNAVFWCGTGAVVRIKALEDVGGVATETITEDIHTSIRMHKRGWRIVAHNEVLARGLAASDARQYMLQRERWARGAMQVMRSENLLTSPRLSITQRLAYGATLIAWFDSLRSMLYVMLPIGVLASGAMPIDAPLAIFGPMFLGTFAIQFTALRLLARGHYPPILSVTFETLRMPAVIPALAELIRPLGRGKFKVTPKGRQGDARDRVRTPRLIFGLITLSLAAFWWFAFTLAGWTPLHYGSPGAMYGTAWFLAGNVIFLLIASRRVRHPKYAGERRASVRFPVDMTVTVDDSAARMIDVSLTGARVVIPWREFPTVAEGDTILLRLVLSDLRLKSTVVRALESSRGLDLGLEFEPGQWSAVRELALILFHGDGALQEQAKSSQAA